MVTDEQVKRLWQVLSSGKTLVQSADKASMDEKTARKYRRLGRLPSEVVPDRSWRTRADLFAEVWPEVHAQLHEAPGLEAKTLFGAPRDQIPGEVRRNAVAQLSAWRETLASDGRPGEGGVLQPSASSGTVVCVGFHPHGKPGRDHWRAVVRPSALPLRADVLELGVGDGLFFREFREPRRRTSRRPVGIGRRARTTPHGSDEPGGQQRIGHEGVHRAVQGTVGLLRDGDGEDPAPGTERERRCRTIASAFQGSGGAGPVIAWQPGLREP